MVKSVTTHNTSFGRLIFYVAGFVIIVAGMRAASPILVPFLLALFISVICTPPLYFLKRKGLPEWLAVITIVVSVLGIGISLGLVISGSLNAFLGDLPLYQIRLREEGHDFVLWLNSKGLEVSEDVFFTQFNPNKIVQMIATTLTGLTGLLTKSFLIILAVVFMLLEVSTFPEKLRMALSDPENSLKQFQSLSHEINHYLALKTLFSFLTGVFITIWLTVTGIEYALLWGLIAFLLNYIPNIGSILAAVPAVMLALVQFGLEKALLTCLGYLVVNVAIGSITEPRFLGRGLGLSTLVVFVSLIFWGWVLGPIGMLLSVPLTMIFKLILENSEEMRWIAVLLGSPRKRPRKQ